MTFTTVQDRIHNEHQLPFNPRDKSGPKTELYFHELTSSKRPSQKALALCVTTILGILFVLTLPFIALLIKSASGNPVFRKINATGRRGIIFQQYVYSTKQSDISKPTLVGSFLEKTGLYKLPTVINIWRGEVTLIGPLPYAAKWCNEWSNQLSDYYKRFAVRPGFLSVAEKVSDPKDIDEVTSALDKELKYILNPSLKKDLKVLFGIF